jgi:hypothetical protein
MGLLGTPRQDLAVLEASRIVDPAGSMLLESAELFHGHGFRKVTWLVYVATATHGDVVGEQLQR